MVLEWHEILLACIRGVYKLAPTVCARYLFITQASCTACAMIINAPKPADSFSGL